MADIAEVIMWATTAKPPTLGTGRLVCVDGRAGAGKSTLGRALLAAARDLGTARLIEVDDMLDGWSGLATVSARIDSDVVGPLRERRSGRYRRYDWDRERFAEWHTVDPVDTLVLEGCGSGASAYRDAITTLVWVEAPRHLRLERGIARDGEALRPQWLTWMDDEDALFARERTRERADVVVDGTGGTEPAVVLC